MGSEFLNKITGFFDSFKVDGLFTFAISAAVLLLTIAVVFAFYLLVKKLLCKISDRVFSTRQTYLHLQDSIRRLAKNVALLLPLVILLQVSPIVFADYNHVQALVMNIIQLFQLFLFAMIISTCVDIAVIVLRRKPSLRDVAIKSYGQVFKIILYVITGILILAMIANRNPWTFISGLGALTAILALTFKDSILGFVASIQLSANHLVREGDWVEMPKYGADGDVIEITLNTVKIRNFDMTITTIPTYAFISDSFKNWRGMSESSGRRIKRSINIDLNSIKFCTRGDIQKFKQIKLLDDFLTTRHERINNLYEDRSLTVGHLNAPQMTNIGVFRHYVIAYLRSLPIINQNMTLLVRHLQPTDAGLPIEIYVFSKEQRWVEYENVQADIFDHILSVLPIFELRAFQQPTGADFQALHTAHDAKITHKQNLPV